MLSKEAAKKIGIDACADKLGRDFILAHKNYAISIYGESADSVYCFVGVDDQHRPQNNFDTFVLDGPSQFPFRASCNVSLEDGYLTVSANTNKNVEEKDENKNYIRRERQFGSCSRSFYVGDVNQEDISASYDNGILNISFPKAGKQIESKKNIDIK